MGHNKASDKSKTNWKQPLKLTHQKRKKNSKSFLGAIQYVSQYMKNLSANTDFLRKLLKKQNDWKWTDEQTEAFNKLKESFTKIPCLSHPNVQSENIITTDASTKKWEQHFGRNKKPGN